MVIVLILVLFMYALYLFSNDESAFSPGKLLSIYWIINIFLGLIVYNFSYKWNIYPLLYLLANTVLFYVGYHIGIKILIKKSKKTYSFANKTGITKIILTVCILAGIGFAVLNLTNNGFTVENAISDFYKVSHYFGKARYQGEGANTTILGQIMLTLFYSSFALEGFIRNHYKNLNRFTILSFTVAVFIMFYTSGKTIVVSGILLWISGYLVQYALQKVKKKTFIDKEKIKRVFVVIIASVAAFYTFFQSFVFRYGGTTYTNIAQRILVYATGHIPCFDYIFKNSPFTLFGEGYGYFTFTWLFDLFGISSNVGQKYDFTLYTKLGMTNVPTIFTDFIMDFGYIGCLFECFLLGMVVGYIYKRCKRTESGAMCAMTGLSYYCILYSFLVNPMRYLSIVGAFILFGVYVEAIHKIKIE